VIPRHTQKIVQVFAQEKNVTNLNMSTYAGYGPPEAPKTFVLCFDGTGNKFSADSSDSNILKIFRVSEFPYRWWGLV
jgi:uncharacterized protein (DUF2235 family)